MSTTTPGRRGWLAPGLAGLLLLLGACGSSGTPVSKAESSTSMTGAESTKVLTRTDLRGKRYCEVLLLHPTPAGPTADVYVSPLDGCPERQWRTLDAAAIAKEHGAIVAVLNGPRYWLMDRIDKQDPGPHMSKSFGGIEMTQRATVLIPDLIAGAKPYVVNSVNRSTVFTFDRGTTVYEMTTPDGTRYVMQSWSQQIDPTLEEGDLAALSSRLQLPAGWTYRARILTAPLQVVTTATTAKVIQDELKNSYSMETN